MEPRQPDGSLPDIPFLKLYADSRLIDKGTDIDIPFIGDAPDLGAYEFGGTTGIQVRWIVPETMPEIFSQGNTGFQEIHVFDPAGRRIDNNLQNRIFQPFIYKRLQSDGRTKTSIIIRTT
jgi:hypothetical protein